MHLRKPLNCILWAVSLFPNNYINKILPTKYLVTKQLQIRRFVVVDTDKNSPVIAQLAEVIIDPDFESVIAVLVGRA